MDAIKENTVKFTVERQVDGKLPFLNVMCEIVNGFIEVDIPRLPSQDGSVPWYGTFYGQHTFD